MSLDIKTAEDKPRRQTFGYVARRLGADKPATRYQEATFDLQPTTNFHYRPSADPRYEMYDTAKTKVVMQDWYALTDPRQFYYGTYTQARARLSEAFEKSLSFIEKSGAFRQLDDTALAAFRFYLLPLRHYEWGANMNNCAITSEGYGTAVTQATMFATMDRLGLAQMISRIGLALDGNSGTSLTEAKGRWMDDARWQPLRRVVEDTFVVDDWYELLVAQDFALDGIVYALFYGSFERAGRNGAMVPGLLTETFREWQADCARWIDSVLKNTAAESPANAALLAEWYSAWRDRALDACRPIAIEVLGEDAELALADAAAALDRRAAANGLTR